MKQKSITRKSILFAVLLVLMACGTANAAIPGFSTIRDELQDKINIRQDFTHLVKQAGPAVVNISTERTTQVRSTPFPFGPEFFRGSPFEGMPDSFFHFGPGPQLQPQQRKQSSLGSGFIISADGYIVTNNHVVEGADVVRVNFDNVKAKENSFEAKVVGTDKQTDLALLKIEASDLPFITFGDSDALEVGEWVVAIGNPFGLDHSVTAGILSAKFRNIDSSSLVRFLQTDASINPGNSGGPLINMKGEVIGINTAIAAQGQGIGFAIPSTLASQIIETLKSDRKVSRGWLGVTIQKVDAQTAKALGLPKAAGALIGNVIAGQPAEKAGIEAGDVILKIDGKEIKDNDHLLQTIAGMKPGATIKATVWRNGDTKTIKITLAERDKGMSGADPEQDKKDPQKAEVNALGVQLRPLEPQELNRLKLDANKGALVVLALDPDKALAKSGIRKGDVIVSINRTSVNKPDEFYKLATKFGKKNGAFMLQIIRGGQSFMQAVEFDAK